MIRSCVDYRRSRGGCLVYAAERGHAFIDRALYLPKSWTADAERCRAAGVPSDVRFATKPALAAEMITRALDAGVPAAWVAGDEVYGGDSKLRAGLHERAIGYVLAVASDHQITTHAGKHPAKALARRLPSRARNRLSAGVGAKGHRWYDWALIDVTDPDIPGGTRCWFAARSAPVNWPSTAANTDPGATGHPGRHGRTPLDDRGVFPSR
jgi:hypothetical protein